MLPILLRNVILPAKDRKRQLYTLGIIQKRNVLIIVVSAYKVNVRYIIFVTRIRKIVLIPLQVIIIVFW